MSFWSISAKFEFLCVPYIFPLQNMRLASHYTTTVIFFEREMAGGRTTSRQPKAWKNNGPVFYFSHSCRGSVRELSYGTIIWSKCVSGSYQLMKLVPNRMDFVWVMSVALLRYVIWLIILYYLLRGGVKESN